MAEEAAIAHVLIQIVADDLGEVSVEYLANLVRRARMAIKFWLFRNSLWLLVVVLVVGLIWWFESEGARRALLAVAVSSLTFFYFLQKQQLAETRLMKELITDFNSRYGAMTEALQEILEKGQGRPELLLSPDEQEVLVNYFNLCAEEYLFYDLGYVEPRVWTAWSNGMDQYTKDIRIWEFWKQERQSGSYYGFEFPDASRRPAPPGRPRWTS